MAEIPANPMFQQPQGRYYTNISSRQGRLPFSNKIKKRNTTRYKGYLAVVIGLYARCVVGHASSYGQKKGLSKQGNTEIALHGELYPQLHFMASSETAEKRGFRAGQWGRSYFVNQW